MNSQKIVKTFITALQSGDFAEATNNMAPDFKFIGWTSQPLNEREFLAFQAELDAGMPDFSYNLSDLHGHGDVVEGLIQVSGTHTGDMAFPQFGIQTMPVTGQAVILPQVPVKFILKDGKIAEMRVKPVPGGGLAGLLQQLAAEVPIPPRIKDIGQLAGDPHLQELEERIDEPAFGQSSTSFPVSEYPE